MFCYIEYREKLELLDILRINNLLVVLQFLVFNYKSSQINCYQQEHVAIDLAIILFTMLRQLKLLPSQPEHQVLN